MVLLDVFDEISQIADILAPRTCTMTPHRLRATQLRPEPLEALLVTRPRPTTRRHQTMRETRPTSNRRLLTSTRNLSQGSASRERPDALIRTSHLPPLFAADPLLDLVFSSLVRLLDLGLHLRRSTAPGSTPLEAAITAEAPPPPSPPLHRRTRRARPQGSSPTTSSVKDSGTACLRRRSGWTFGARSASTPARRLDRAVTEERR